MSTSLLPLLSKYVEYFNNVDKENVVQAIPNSQAREWMEEHIPLVRLPEPMLEQAYYFRWWVYRKHIKNTPDGLVVTEFHPDVPWAGKHNTIVASACHHIEEGRWLKGTPLLREYITFLYRQDASTRSYSNWLESAVLNFCKTHGDSSFGEELLPRMIENYTGWVESNQHASGLYWSIDDRDASEFSISGNGLRPTLNCYQYANGKAIAEFATRSRQSVLASEFLAKSEHLRWLINSKLWHEQDSFYKVISLRYKEDVLSTHHFDPQKDVREIWGYLPWRFHVAPPGREIAFKQLLDPNGFAAAYGLTTAERRHHGFGLFYTGEELNDWLEARGENPIGPKGHECLWNGPTWPFSTCLTLGALANLIVEDKVQDIVNAFDFVRLLTQYARSHVRRLANGEVVPWLDENMNPDTGDWIARTRLMNWDADGWSQSKGGYERGKDYNHSTFCDLVIGGLFGIRPEFDSILVFPLFPMQWPYAQLEGLMVHDRKLNIQYHNPMVGGDGYHIHYDDECVFHSSVPEPFSIRTR